jgi:plastocyanin
MLLIVALAVLVACDGGGAGSTTTDEAPGATTTQGDVTSTTGSSPSTPPDGPTAEITISGFSFGSNQTVAVGTTVTATNRDPFGHTWTSTDQLWDSGTLSEGEGFSFTFDEAGTFSYFCRLHSTEMGGSITVQG